MQQVCATREAPQDGDALCVAQTFLCATQIICSITAACQASIAANLASFRKSVTTSCTSNFGRGEIAAFSSLPVLIHKITTAIKIGCRIFIGYLPIPYPIFGLPLMSSANSHRLNILTSAEINDLYGLPRFGDNERQLFFDMSETEYLSIQSRRASAGIFQALELGYFKAKKQFFVFELDDVIGDLRYLALHHFPRIDLDVLDMPSKPTRRLIRQAILILVSYHAFDAAAKEILLPRMRRSAALSTHPQYIFRDALEFLALQRIVAPLYTSLQDLVGRVVAGEGARVTQLLEQQAPSAIIERLNTLLQGDGQAMTVSAIKREPRDFTPKELRLEVERRQFFAPLHEFSCKFLKLAGLSNESGKYYASLVKYYTLYKLQRMPRGLAQLYLLCFSLHRFRQINDNLIESFIHVVGQFDRHAKQAANEARAKALEDASANLQMAGEILGLFVDGSVPNDCLFSDVQKRAFALLDQQTFTNVTNYLRNVAFDKLAFEWDCYAKLAQRIKIHLRQLFCELDFSGRVEDAPLLNAVTILQDLLRRKQSLRQADASQFPTALIPNYLKRHLYCKEHEEGKSKKLLDMDRYEILIYQLLRNALESGDLYVNHSKEFRRFEDDLISDERWQQKDAILAEIGLPILLTPIEETLANFRKAVEDRFKAVNQRIADGVNQHIKIKGKDEKKRWTLIYPTAPEQINHSFYSQLPGISIADLLRFVAKEAGFLNAFTHVLGRYTKQAPDAREIFACIVGYGTNMGLGKMAEVSGMGHASLMTTARNFLRPETLHSAIDAISNAIAKLPVFGLFNIRDELHSSSDGQRIETQINTFNARHAPKYFGLEKGVSVSTVVANHVPINAKVIGTHEHESHYVFDLLYNNTSDIRPTRHSTDTHGTNQVNFFTLLTFEHAFAPRYKNLRKKTSSLVGFKPISQYPEDMLIRPSSKADEALIIREWPTVQRIMVSLAQKDTSQATIVRKLSSYARQNQTQKALWELDNICRTMYILDFIDDADLRQGVQAALNRGEAYHRFRRSVAYVNGGKFKVKTEAEQQVWNECSRLIANAVIYYNMVLLSKVYEQKLAAGDLDAVAFIKGMSPVAWQHVNLFGSIEFSDDDPDIDIAALAARYADAEFWHQATQDDAVN